MKSFIGIPLSAFYALCLLLAVFLSFPQSASCGDLWIWNTPSSPGSATWSIEDMYQWLTGNREVTRRQGPFQGPSAPPVVGTGHDLDAVMEAMQTGGFLARTRLPRTGRSITSSMPGDDGYWKAGVLWPPRLKDNGNGTLTDNLTGLIWIKTDFPSAPSANWEGIFTLVAELNASGTISGYAIQDTSNNGSHQTDWRVPNVNELLTLLSYGKEEPASAFFPPGPLYQSFGSWTSTTYANDTAKAWLVILEFGEGEIRHDLKSNSRMFLPVRGGSR